MRYRRAVRLAPLLVTAVLAAGCTTVVAGALAGTVVYLDGRELGPLTLLRTMPAETAEKMCYYNMNQAQSRYGMGVITPVVAVFSRGSRMAEDAC